MPSRRRSGSGSGSEAFGMECAMEYSRENLRRRPGNQKLFRAQRNAHDKELQSRLPRKRSSSVGPRKRFTTVDTELHGGRSVGSGLVVARCSERIVVRDSPRRREDVVLAAVGLGTESFNAILEIRNPSFPPLTTVFTRDENGTRQPARRPLTPCTFHENASRSTEVNL